MCFFQLGTPRSLNTYRALLPRVWQGYTTSQTINSLIELGEGSVYLSTVSEGIQLELQCISRRDWRLQAMGIMRTIGTTARHLFSSLTESIHENGRGQHVPKSLPKWSAPHLVMPPPALGTLYRSYSHSSCRAASCPNRDIVFKNETHLRSGPSITTEESLGVSARRVQAVTLVARNNVYHLRKLQCVNATV